MARQLGLPLKPAPPSCQEERGCRSPGRSIPRGPWEGEAAPGRAGAASQGRREGSELRFVVLGVGDSALWIFHSGPLFTACSGIF